jgi:hypothetical protein
LVSYLLKVYQARGEGEEMEEGEEGERGGGTYPMETFGSVSYADLINLDITTYLFTSRPNYSSISCQWMKRE